MSIRAAWVHDNHGVCPDNGARICALLDAGADLSVRDGSDLNDSSTATTALLHLIRSSNLSLARALLLYNAPVNANNDDGKVYLRAAEKMLRSQYANMAGERREEWRDFIEEIKKKANFEKELKAEKDRARAMANDE